MTNKEAIKLTKSSACLCESKYQDEWEETVVKALKKQESKKPINNSRDIYFCPICKGSLWQNADECKYCFRCGQAIDWSGVK